MKRLLFCLTVLPTPFRSEGSLRWDGRANSQEATMVKLEAQLETGASCGPTIKPVAYRTGIWRQVRCPDRLI